MNNTKDIDISNLPSEPYKFEPASSKSQFIDKITRVDYSTLLYLSREELTKVLYSNDFQNINKQELNDHQTSILLKFIQVNNLIKQNILTIKACELANLKTDYFYWAISLFPDCRNFYLNTQKTKSHLLAELALKVAADDSKDFYYNEAKGLMPNNVAVTRSALLVNALNHYISKINKQDYGNSTTISGDENNPLRIETITGMVVK